MTNRDSDNKYKADTARQEKLDTSTQHYVSTDVDGIEEKKLLRKIDWRLLPILGALYSISLVSHPRKSPAESSLTHRRSTVPTSQMLALQVWAPTLL
jgi:hypothetical protein